MKLSLSFYSSSVVAVVVVGQLARERGRGRGDDRCERCSEKHSSVVF
jgi:ribosomal protein S14